jgi:hypothetical protein
MGSLPVFGRKWDPFAPEYRSLPPSSERNCQSQTTDLRCDERPEGVKPANIMAIDERPVSRAVVIRARAEEVPSRVSGLFEPSESTRLCHDGIESRNT